MSSRAHGRMPTLLVGFDFRARSTRALAHAMRMLDRRCASQIHVVHVLAEERRDDEGLLAAIPSAIAEVVRCVAAERALVGPAWAHVRIGSVHDEIRDLALELGADMVVLGSRGPWEPWLSHDPYANVSVLVAGDRLELESRLGGSATCAACEAAREASELASPWCPTHRPRGIVPPLRMDLRRDRDDVRDDRAAPVEVLGSRLLH